MPRITGKGTLRIESDGEEMPVTYFVDLVEPHPSRTGRWWGTLMIEASADGLLNKNARLTLKDGKAGDVIISGLPTKAMPALQFRGVGWPQ
ncbi:MAG: hypothetical protein NTZ05_16045 [Chloroflexi bacterium]|nr:hypothetical protein [Chloroflexota bacterium]